jgi:hypothetical protein
MSSKDKPFELGKYNRTSLRVLTGTLQALREIQTNGYGGGQESVWYRLVLEQPAWIIVIKSGLNPNYYQVTPFDGNKDPIEPRAILQADEIFPDAFQNQVAASMSTLYNTFDPVRLDQGNSLYFALPVGQYFFNVSNTRNDPQDYEIGLIIETKETFGFIQTEENEGELFVLENTIDDGSSSAVIVESPIISNQTIGPSANAFTADLADINTGVTVTVDNSNSKGVTWLITETPSASDEGYFLLDAPDLYFETIRDRSLSAWKSAWAEEFGATATFPALFVPYANRA